MGGRTLALVAAFAVALAARAATFDPGELPAEPARLASRSLLLDVARAGSRIVAVGERGHILLSDDQGRTWRQANAVPTQNLLTAVCFIDARRGVAVGHDEIVLITADAGETWSRTHYAPQSQQPLLDVLCMDREVIAVGAYSVYFTSADSGMTWNERKFDAAPIASPRGASGSPGTSQPAGPDDIFAEDYHLNHIAGDAGSRLYIAAEAGHLYRSDDAGVTWKTLPSPYEGSFFGVLPLNGDALLAFGLRGHLYRSDNAGLTWRAIETGTVAMLDGAVKLPDGGIAIVGLSGVVLVSTDGGEHFTLRQESDRKGISAALPVSATELVTVGEAGVKRIRIGARP